MHPTHLAAVCDIFATDRLAAISGSRLKPFACIGIGIALFSYSFWLETTQEGEGGDSHGQVAVTA
jgi:hypothetical protein